MNACCPSLARFLRAAPVALALAPLAHAAGSLSELSPQDRAGLRAAHEVARHAASPTESGYAARNPDQGWALRFDGRGVSVEPEGGGWSWGLELERYGFAGSELEVGGRADLRADGNRVANRWSGALEEWYVNDGRGLEHGFTLRERPERAGTTEGDPLTLTLRVRGRLEARVNANRRGVRFVGTNGGTALTYSGLSVLDADGRALDAWIETAPEGLRLSVDECGARYPLTIDPIAEEAYLKASNPDMSDSFGFDVAVSGDTIVVGAYAEDSAAAGVGADQTDNSASRAGAAYVFVRSGSTWTQQAYLKASHPDDGDWFGFSVDVDGDTIVVGAIGEDSEAVGVNHDETNELAMASGAAYVFVRNGTTWTQEAYLKASNTDPFDAFGYSVAISGDTIVVGANQEKSAAVGVNSSQANNSLSFAGAAYVFVRSGTAWSQEAYVKASNTGDNDNFGTDVAIDGDTIVVGAYGEKSTATGVDGDQSNNSLTLAGAAYVYTRTGTTWTQEAYLKASNTDFNSWFGRTVAVSGDTVLVGAPSEDSDATGVNGDEENLMAHFAGAAYVFRRSGTTWSQEAYLKASNTSRGDHFGDAVAVSGDTAVVACKTEASDAMGPDGDGSNNNAPVSGAAYVYVRSGSTWTHDTYLKAPNSEAGDEFGYSVGVDGDTLVVSSRVEDGGSAGVGGDPSDNSLPGSGAVFAQRLNPSLASEVTSVSLSAGGQQGLDLDGGIGRANWFYWMFGSATGTAPGFSLAPGFALPLNFDGYFNLTLTKPGLGAFGNFLGQLDASGQATATLTVPPGVDPSLAGVTLHHAYLASAVLGQADFASRAVPVLLAP